MMGCLHAVATILVGVQFVLKGDHPSSHRERPAIPSQGDQKVNGIQRMYRWIITLDIQTPPEVRYLDPKKTIPKTHFEKVWLDVYGSWNNSNGLFHCGKTKDTRKTKSCWRKVRTSAEKTAFTTSEKQVGCFNNGEITNFWGDSLWKPPASMSDMTNLPHHQNLSHASTPFRTMRAPTICGGLHQVPAIFKNFILADGKKHGNNADP